MSYSIRPILIEDKIDLDGKAPIKICITVNRKRHYHSLKHKVTPEQWNEQERRVRKNHEHAQLLNRTILNKINEIEGIIIDIEAARKRLTLSEVVLRLKGKNVNDNLFEFAESYFKDHALKFSFGTLKGYDSCIAKLKSYQDPLYFSDVTVQWLRKYEHWLRSQIIVTKKGSKPVENNTVHRHWKFLRKLFNAAIKDGIAAEYPFKNYDNPPKYKQTDRTHLTEAEVNKIEALLNKPLKQYQVVTINYFLLGCYSGLRFSDWQRFNYEGFVRGERLTLWAKKNGQLVSMKIHKRLRKVVEALKTLPPVNNETDTREVLLGVAKMAGINKHITTHTGRHTFGTLCAEKGIPIESTAEFLGVTIVTCKIYYKITGTKLDKDIEKWND